MAANYSWSCKRYAYPYPSIKLLLISTPTFIHKIMMQCRSYKTGFVWHNLSADDLLLPTQGTEYVLPFDQSASSRLVSISSMNHEEQLQSVHFEPLLIQIL